MSQNSARNKRILALVAQRRLSYELIAYMVGCTRNVVAGVVFRAAHPHSERCSSPHGNGRNKIGTGYRPKSYEPELTAPEFTALNTR